MDRLGKILADLIAKRCEAFSFTCLNRLVDDGWLCVRRLPEIQDELYKAMQATGERRTESFAEGTIQRPHWRGPLSSRLFSEGSL